MTLAELLVALTLLGMLSVMMMGGLRFGARAWEGTQERSGQINAVVRTHAFLRARLSGIARTTSIAGESDRLSFTALWMTALGGGGFYEFELTWGDEGIVLSWHPSRDDERDSEAWETLSGKRVLLDDVSGLDIAWFGQPPGYPAPEWIDHWQIEWGAPILIRVEIGFDDPRHVWPTLTVGLPARG